MVNHHSTTLQPPFPTGSPGAHCRGGPPCGGLGLDATRREAPEDRRAKKRRRGTGGKGGFGTRKAGRFLGEIIPFYGPTIQVNVKIYKIYPDLWWMNGGYIMMFNDFKTIFNDCLYHE